MIRPWVPYSVLVLAATLGGWSIWGAWQKNITLASRQFPVGNDPLIALHERRVTQRKRAPLQVIKGLYLTAYSAGNPKKLDEIIALIDRTELNAVVIDIKDYSGLVLYDTAVPLATAFHLKDNRLKDVSAMIKKLHEHHIYAIARQTVFQDPILAANKPDWSIKSTAGGLWHDRHGLSWVDASRREVWEYNAAIAREAASLGFDEINFDYVRFPSDGNIGLIAYTTGDKKKYTVIHDFFHYLQITLADVPVRISVDLFGFVMEKTGEDDMKIGQRLVDAVDEVDYVSPMMYPSHYPTGHLGLKNPADNPAMVLSHGLAKGVPVFAEARAWLRPWIQAFNLGAVYDASKIRAQIDAIEKYPNTGWLLWNAANRYTDAGLRGEE